MEFIVSQIIAGFDRLHGSEIVGLVYLKRAVDHNSVVFVFHTRLRRSFYFV